MGYLSPPTDADIARLSYDAESGLLRWKIDGGSPRAGHVAGWPERSSYIRVMLSQKSYMAHRLAWYITHGKWPKNQLDHINGVRGDNRISNLREANHSENQQNKHVPPSSNSSGILGVSYLKKDRRWRADIKVDGKSTALGTFGTAQQAREAYLEAKAKLHPFAPRYRGAGG